jgi:uncharacterized protein YodC (DUF2158 family)
MAHKIKIGSVVQLNSGGPLMTVVQIDQTQQLVKCTWFLEGGEMKTSYFQGESLKTVKKEKEV